MSSKTSGVIRNMRIEADGIVIGRGKPRQAINGAISFLRGLGICTAEIENINTTEIETLTKMFKAKK